MKPAGSVGHHAVTPPSTSCLSGQHCPSPTTPDLVNLRVLPFLIIFYLPSPSACPLFDELSPVTL